MIRKWLLGALALCLAWSLPALAGERVEAATSYESYAQQLKELGLFKGTNSGFELERSPERLEAVVMLIRLLGKEQEALEAANAVHPFEDVPGWGSPYVAYAYREGLTKGVSERRFGSDQPMTAQQYYTFVLRSLGYSEEQGDFMYSEAVAKAATLGVATGTDYNKLQGPFLRGHMVDISYHALQAPLKDDGRTLREKLQQDGVLSEPGETDVEESGAEQTAEPDEAADENDGGVEVALLPEPELVDVNYGPLYLLDMAAIQSKFPQARYYSQHSHARETGWLARLSEETKMKIVTLEAMWSRLTPIADNATVGVYDNDFSLPAIALWNENREMIALMDPDSFAAAERKTTFLTDLEQLQRNISAEMARIRGAEGAVYVPNTVFYRDINTYPDRDEEGNEIMVEYPTMRINREALPARARSFTQLKSVNYFGGTGTALLTDQAAMKKALSDWEKHNVVEQLLGSYVTVKYRETEGVSWLVNPTKPVRYSVMLLMLMDDKNNLLGYTYFTADEMNAME